MKLKNLPLLALMLLLFSCGKEETGVPNVPVNFKASLNDPRLQPLGSPGAAVLINGHGVAGLVIYRRPDYSYVAYDRCSTVNPEERCAVTLDSPSLTVTDPCSSAKFSLMDGAPVKAPAKKYLKQYQVVITQFELSVVN